MIVVDADHAVLGEGLAAHPASVALDLQQPGKPLGGQTVPRQLVRLVPPALCGRKDNSPPGAGLFDLALPGALHRLRRHAGAWRMASSAAAESPGQRHPAAADRRLGSRVLTGSRVSTR